MLAVVCFVVATFLYELFPWELALTKVYMLLSVRALFEAVCSHPNCEGFAWAIDVADVMDAFGEFCSVSHEGQYRGGRGPPHACFDGGVLESAWLRVVVCGELVCDFHETLLEFCLQGVRLCMEVAA